MSKKMTFAEKLKMQKESSEGSESEKLVEEKVEVETPKKAPRKPRKKKTEEVQEVTEEVEGGAVEEGKPKRKPRKKKEVLECTVASDEKAPEKPKKEKRAPSAYNLFVKDAYKSKEVQKLPPKERFAKVAELWHKEKGKK